MRDLSAYRGLLRPLTARLVPALAGLALLATAAPALAQTPTFAPIVPYSTGANSGPSSIAVADVNGDGKPDLLTANYYTGTAGVLLGNGNGTFQAVAAYSTGPPGSHPVSIAVADVNGDGKPDLLTANYNANTAGVLLGNGNGTFQTVVLYDTGTGSYPSSIAVADVNGDGKPDLLTANNTASTAGVLLGNGNGTFQALVAYSTGAYSYPYSIAVADVNGDNKPDLLTANSNNDTAGVLLGNGNGTFRAVVPYSTGTNSSPASIAVADVNGDGKPDLLTANTGTAGVLLGNGNGTFQTVVPYSTGTGTGSYSLSIAVADVNGDGKPDLLTANNTNTAGVLLGNGNGTFQALVSYSTGTGSNPQSIAVTDVNGDGKPDLFTANFNTSTAGVLLNTTTTTLTSLSPTSGPVGTSITLTGTNLTGATGISFNGTAATTFAVVNATTATATVPPGATTGNVTITTPGGTSNGVAFTVTVATPVLTSITPTAAPIGGTVTLNGTGLAGTSVVTFDQNPFDPNTNNQVTSGYAVNPAGTQITGIVVPSTAISGTVRVTTPGGTSNTVFFSVIRAVVLVSVSPNAGPVGTVVTLSSSGRGNMSGITAVSFNGTPATVFSASNDFTATATVPAGATTGNVTVTNSGGPSNGVAFTLVTDLVVNTGTPLSPTLIAAGTYNSITVTGTGNAVLAGNVSVAEYFIVQPGGGFSDGCSIISGTGTFSLGAGSILGICNAAGITSSGATGAVQVTGPRSFSTGASYGYNTNAAVTGNGLPGTVASLAINTAGNVTLTAPVAVSVAVGVGGAGNLVLGGNALTLLSSASGTALAVNSSTGAVVGTATVQRYIDPTTNAGPGYRHYSAPVSNTTMADLATVGFAPTLTTSYNASATPGTTTPFPTVFGYDQSRVTLANSYAPFDRGFVVPTALTTPLAVGQGYAVNIAGNQLVDFVGTLTTGDQPPVALARVAANPDAGWQLLGNPYPAPLNYALVLPADRLNLDGAIYVYGSFGPYVGTYRSYVNGIGGNSVLPVAQGFFVRVSAGQTSGALTFRNSQRLTAPNATAFQRGAADARPLVQLELRTSTGTLADALYAYAQAGATPAFDSQFDAEKLPNPTGLNLSSTATSGQRLAIDGRPVFDAATVLPLNVGVPAAGSYTFSAGALANLPAGLDAFLRDAQTGQAVNLRTQPAYAFSVTAAQATALLVGRFALVFAAPATALAVTPALTAAQVELYPNPAHARFAVLMPGVPGASAVQAELVNSLGQVVRRQSAALPASGATLTVETGALAAGVYTLRLLAGPTTLAKRVVLY